MGAVLVSKGELWESGLHRLQLTTSSPGALPQQHDCEYCQYHIQAQYKKLSAKRSDLQSTFSGGRIPKKFRKGTSLKERLCQDGFYYGGVSSESFAASM